MHDIAVQTEGSHITVSGAIAGRTYKRLLAAIHTITSRSGYPELTVSLEHCAEAYPAPMLAVSAQIIALRDSGIYTSLVLPGETKLARLFQNANWAHLIDPRRYDPSRFRGRSRLPATEFKSPGEQQAVVNKTVTALLESMPGLERSQFAAFEWAINEVTDNVLVHSRTRTGGLVQVSLQDRDRSIVEFDVCDAGLGIPNTLREGHPDIHTDSEALDRAIREGVTRNKSIGQGNGLFGSYQVCALSLGGFQIHSGYANLIHDQRSGLHVYPEQIPFSGALVVGRINFAEKGLLEHALKFGGRTYVPPDFIDTHYEDGERNVLVFRLSEEASSFGSRIAGIPVRNKLANLLLMSDCPYLHVSFEGVPIISSSFADEVFGKLFVELGPVQFGQRIRLEHVPALVAGLIDKAIMQRAAQPQKQ